MVNLGGKENFDVMLEKSAQIVLDMPAKSNLMKKSQPNEIVSQNFITNSTDGPDCARISDKFADLARQEEKFDSAYNSKKKFEFAGTNIDEDLTDEILDLDDPFEEIDDNE